MPAPKKNQYAEENKTYCIWWARLPCKKYTV